MISWSGHYVRDPFSLKQLSVARLLRRQSRPAARILRDVGLGKPPSLWAILAGILVASLTFATLEGWTPENNPVEGFIEGVNEAIESPEDSP
ncbi:hypothetical protein LKK83_13505 [Phormidium sp. CCY1219]|nr:hypothetical protein [Phormidium sp. CCY1219]